MKRFLENNNFEKYFDSHILYRGEAYYRENRILDIWYQNNIVTSYIEGSEIYKVELKIDNDEINSYCSCPYSETIATFRVPNFISSFKTGCLRCIPTSNACKYV